MPRTADHDARRRQVLDALCRITVRGGLDAATFREIASEAGVSVRLVQYYFGTKADLLSAGTRYALERSAKRLLVSIEALGPEPAPRAVITAAMRSFLPTDADARDAMVLFYAFYAARLTNSDSATAEADSGGGLQRLFAQHLTRAQQEGLIPPDVDPDREAAILFLLLPSLASGAITGQVDLGRAEDIVDYAINRIFGPPTSDEVRPAARRTPTRRTGRAGT
jgi:TetR/AcrR family transcriptional regulator, transcriptional repressor of bet genes